MYYRTSDAVNQFATSSCSSPFFFFYFINNLVPGHGPCSFISSFGTGRKMFCSSHPSVVAGGGAGPVASARGARGQLIPGNAASVTQGARPRPHGSGVPW